MNTLMKFENTSITISTDNNEPLFEVYKTGMVLGYSTVSKGMAYPHKSRIDRILKNADIKPVVHGVQLFLTENQLYDFMLEARTEKCRYFRKWVTDEVIPTIRKTGKYEVPSQPSQLTLREIEHERLKSVLKATGYSYYDKTFNGEPVISLKDVAYYTGISPETAISALRKHGKYGKDYFKVDHAQMMDFKSENRNVPACYTHLMLVTKSGFILLAELYGLDKDVFGCFAEPAPALPEHKEILLPTPIELDTRSCIIALGVIQKLIDNAESDLENGRSLYPDVTKENIKAFKRTLKWTAMPIT